MTDAAPVGPDCDDPVFLYKDAFVGMADEMRRCAALGRIMQNPKGFVKALAEPISIFIAKSYLTIIINSDSAPKPLRIAARAQLETIELLDTRLKTENERHLEKLFAKKTVALEAPREDLRNRNWMETQAKKRPNENLRLKLLPVFALHNGKLVRPMLVFSAIKK